MASPQEARKRFFKTSKSDLFERNFIMVTQMCLVQNICKKTGLPEPPFLAGAGAFFFGPAPAPTPTPNLL